MVHNNTMRWSSRSQDLLARAVVDPAYINAMQAKGLSESQLHPWVAKDEVPISFRDQAGSLVEDWTYANLRSCLETRR